MFSTIAACSLSFIETAAKWSEPESFLNQATGQLLN